MIKEYETIFRIIRKALSPSSAVSLPADANWQGVMDFAAKQGLSGLCFEAIELLPAELRPERHILMNIFGQAEYLKKLTQKQWAVTDRLGKMFSFQDSPEKGIRLTILKGHSIAQYYPVPEHRYSCDVDVFAFDFQKACDVLEENGVRLEKEMYKDVSFDIDGVHFELHKYITPVRGNDNLKHFEKYLRQLLLCEPSYEEGPCLPPLMFTVLLWVEHALGDLLQGHLTFRHFVDWVVLRRQNFDNDVFEARCREFGFDKFVRLADAIADAIEGRCEITDMERNDRELLERLLAYDCDEGTGIACAGRWMEKHGGHSWMKARIRLMTEILGSAKLHSRYGYDSMSRYLWNKVWSHFFEKDVEL